ncbi:MAG: CDP-diacylglycerol--glycerol-3-phosphate 3-phosphatidyltransferase [Henriciella sp.]|nr:CDP-diacylglycerol--glycerol-3-phosphate 3-phosphatidyltransferase [Henriciella sp.]
MSLKWLPNTLTIARCLLAGGVAWLILKLPAGSFLPVLAFILVALTDFVDGWAARRFDAVSKFGAFLDPVADKLLVGLALVALTLLAGGQWILLIPTAVIILRDTIATILRLFPNIEMPVSQLAKWKTALEMVGIAALLLAAPFSSALIMHAGTVLVWVAAALSVYTLGLYLGAILADVKRPR